MTTIRLVCACGASVTHADESWRTAETADEFRRVHVREGCAVTEGRDPVLRALYRLKALLGKERAHADRSARGASADGDWPMARQIGAAANAYGLAMAYVDAEIRRAKEGTP